MKTVRADSSVLISADGTPPELCQRWLLDYDLKRADYIEAFFKNIAWKAVEARLK